MRDNRKTQLVLQVAKSTAVSAVLLFVSLLALNWWWVLGHHGPSMEETLRQYFMRCMTVSCLFSFIQLAIFFAFAVVLALLRDHHSSTAGAFSGLVILGLDIIETQFGIHHHSTPAGVAVLIAAPLIATMLQFIQRPKTDRESNKAPAADAAPPAAPSSPPAAQHS